MCAQGYTKIRPDTTFGHISSGCTKKPWFDTDSSNVYQILDKYLNLSGGWHRDRGSIWWDKAL